jgi:hypothetical protein
MWGIRAVNSHDLLIQDFDLRGSCQYDIALQGCMMPVVRRGRGASINWLLGGGTYGALMTDVALGTGEEASAPGSGLGGTCTCWGGLCWLNPSRSMWQGEGHDTWQVLCLPAHSWFAAA